MHPPTHQATHTYTLSPPPQETGRGETRPDSTQANTNSLSYAYSSGPAARSPTHRTFNRILACVFQLLGMIALGLLSAGSWELATAIKTKTTTKTTVAPPPRRNPHRHESYAGAGAMVLILSAGALCMVAVQGYRGVGRDGQAGDESSDLEEDRGVRNLGGKVVVVPRRERLGARLVLAAGTAGIVLAARVAGGMDWFFGDGQGGNPVTGAMPRRLVTGMVPEAVVVVVLVFGGLSTWDIAW